MELTHTFTVPASLEEAWAAFNDVESVATCFPGASVTSVEGDSFTGSAKVKLGPISLVYSGSGTFVEKDEGAHRMVIEAKGKDKRGNGTAGATVTATMTAAADGTEVTVLTDLSITGKPAQFGRGVMQDVSDKLLGQFVACLESRFTAAPPEPEPAPEAASTADTSTPLADAAAQTAASAPRPSAPSSAPSSTEEPRRPAPPPPPPRQDDALDLGATVLPVLLKSYWKQAAAGLVALLLLKRLLRRR